jgi:hypothetical protein
LQLRNSLLMESYKGQDRVEALTSINSKLISKYKIQN